MKTKFSVLIISLVSLFSCNTNDLYFQYKDIPADGWHKDSVATFNINIEDTINSYNLYVNIRNRGDYVHQNLWLFIEKNNPDSTITNDTINFYLADLRGKWLGSGVGSVFEMPVLYEQNVRFIQKGSYQFKFSHGMREDILKGLNNIGLRIEKAEK